MYPWVFLLFLGFALGALAYGWGKKNIFIYFVGLMFFLLTGMLVAGEGISIVSGVNVDTGAYTYTVINAGNDYSMQIVAFYILGLGLLGFAGMFGIMFAGEKENDE